MEGILSFWADEDCLWLLFHSFKILACYNQRVVHHIFQCLICKICGVSQHKYIRACLKNHSRNLHAPLCGIFCPNSVAVARYGAFIRTKSPTNCDAHLAESLFQTRSRKIYNPKFLRITFASSSAVPSIPKLLLFSIKSIYSVLPGC